MGTGFVIRARLPLYSTSWANGASSAMAGKFQLVACASDSAHLSMSIPRRFSVQLAIGDVNCVVADMDEDGECERGASPAPERKL